MNFIQEFLGRVAIAAISFVILVVGIVVAVVFLCIALHAMLLNYTTPPLAALFSALIVFLAAVMVVLIASVAVRARPRRRRRRGAGRSKLERDAELASLLGERFQSWASTNPRATTLGALLAGFIVGANPRLRDTLRALLDL